MELYTLDSLLRRDRVIESYESLIWTERFNSAGDIEVVIPSSTENRELLATGRWLALDASWYVMRVETVEDGTDEEGKKMLTVKGTSIEMILDDRVARDTLSNLTTESKWVHTGLPAAILRSMFHDICVVGTLSTDDIIPFISEVDILPDDSIPEPADTVTLEVAPKSLYEAIKEIAEMYDLGFRLLRNGDASQLVFNIYSGSDRTSQQTILPSVLFSPELENVSNTREFHSIAGAKNVAYVISPVGHRIVIPQGVEPDVAGFDRRVLLVIADDITDSNPTVANALMDQRGREELAQYRTFGGFDGEISQTSQYKYNVDYYLGDLIEVRNDAGFANTMRVTEQIFVSDKEGERSYPTLSLSRFITPGSWAGWPIEEVWADYADDLTYYWADAP